MVDEDNVRLNSKDVGPVLRTLMVNELGIGQLADERRDLRPHSVLCSQRLMRKLLQYKTLKKRHVKIKSFLFLDCEVVVVDFWTKLSGISVSTSRGTI